MDKKLYEMMDWREIEAIVYAESKQPGNLLGIHKVGREVIIQSFYPDAQKIYLNFRNTSKSTSADKVEMELMDEAGFFAVRKPKNTSDDYYFSVEYENETIECEDAYRFVPEMSTKELNRFYDGTAWDLYDFFGATPTEINKTKGIVFRVYAPNANRVSVVGDFNNWDGRVHQMNCYGTDGIFTIFIPNVSFGVKYQYEIKYKGGPAFRKEDPAAWCSSKECPQISVISERKDFAWDDKDYFILHGKESTIQNALNICEIKFEYILSDQLNTIEKTESFIAEILSFSFTHIEVINMNSSKFFSYGTDEDKFCIQRFVNVCHKNNLSVIFELDCVFFDNNENGMKYYDGCALFEYNDSIREVHPMNNKRMYNLGSLHVQSFLRSKVRFLVENYHVDGFKFTNLSPMLYLDYERSYGNWIPNRNGGNINLEAVRFLVALNEFISEQWPSLIQISDMDSLWDKITGNTQKGALGFDYQWNNMFVRDVVDYVEMKQEAKQCSMDKIIFSMVYGYNEQFILPLANEIDSFEHLFEMLEGTDEEKLTKFRLIYTYIMMHPGKKELYDVTIVHNDLINKYIKALNEFYVTHPALFEYDHISRGFEWVQQLANDDCVVSFLRKCDIPEETLLVFANFSEQPKNDYSASVTKPGRYKVVFCSSDTEELNIPKRGILSDDVKNGKFKNSIKISLPAQSVTVLSHFDFTDKEKEQIAHQKEQKLLNEKEVKKLIKEREHLKLEFEKRQKKIMDDAIEKANKEIAVLEQKYRSDDKRINDDIVKLSNIN